MKNLYTNSIAISINPNNNACPIISSPLPKSINSCSPVSNNGPNCLIPSSKPLSIKVLITPNISFPKSISRPPKCLMSPANGLIMSLIAKNTGIKAINPITANTPNIKYLNAMSSTPLRELVNLSNLICIFLLDFANLCIANKGAPIPFNTIPNSSPIVLIASSPFSPANVLIMVFCSLSI